MKGNMNNNRREKGIDEGNTERMISKLYIIFDYNDNENIQYI